MIRSVNSLSGALLFLVLSGSRVAASPRTLFQSSATSILALTVSLFFLSLCLCVSVANQFFGGYSFRRTTQFPRYKTSIRVFTKQSIASRGVHTMGSFSLNEVLSTTGTPVSSWKSEIS